MEEAGDKEVSGTDAMKKLKQDSVTVTGGEWALQKWWSGKFCLNLFELRSQ